MTWVVQDKIGEPGKWIPHKMRRKMHASLMVVEEEAQKENGRSLTGLSG